MPTQPLSSPAREISVTAVVEPAYDRMKRMLFQPFDLGKWFTIGFCAWLAGVGGGHEVHGNGLGLYHRQS